MDKSAKTTILVCCHKEDFYHSGEGFLPIQVGKEIAPIDLHITGDNTGDNISSKNPNYCELTAHYWLWKNGPKTPYLGLNHYRRYFNFTEKPKRGQETIYTLQEDIEAKFPDLPDMDVYLKDYDILMPAQRHLPYSLEHHYYVCHIYEQWDVVKEVVKHLYPDCIDDFNFVMNSNRLSPCNMFITKREIFEDYSQWLFSILFEVEKRIKIFDSPIQRRVFGYMSERLLNVYVKWKKLRVKYVPIMMVTESVPQNIRPKFRSFIYDFNASVFRFCKRYM